MEKIESLNQMIRKSLKDKYEELKEEFFNKIEDDSEKDCDSYDIENDLEFDIDYEDEFEDEEFDNSFDEFLEENTHNFEEEVLLKLFEFINESKYKNFIYLVLLSDSYEYIKTKQIKKDKLRPEEKEMILSLENDSINSLLHKLKDNNNFKFDILLIFFEYNMGNSTINKCKNRELIEYTNNIKYLDKFGIYKLDDYIYGNKKL